MLCQNSSPSHFHSQKERKKLCPWSGPTTWKIKSLTTVNPQDNFHLEQQLCRTLIRTHLYTLHFSGLPRQGNLLVYALLSLCPAHSHHLPVLMEAARAPMPTTLQHLLHPGPPQKYMPYPLHTLFLILAPKKPSQCGRESLFIYFWRTNFGPSTVIAVRINKNESLFFYPNSGG